jgi:hypothetical protein
MTETTQAGFRSTGHRFGFALCYLTMIATGRVAARLAADFRALGAGGKLARPVSVVLQLPVLACWLLVRPMSLAAYAACCALAPAR